jgi:hypothetical protein
MDKKRLHDIEMIFKELKTALQEQKLSMEDFRREIKQLTHKDNKGNSWRYNGDWYTFTNNNWTLADPYQIDDESEPMTLSNPLDNKPVEKVKADSIQSTNKKPQKKNKHPLLFSLIILIIIAGIVFFITRSGKDNPDDTSSVKTNPKVTKKATPVNLEIADPSIYSFPKAELYGKAFYTTNQTSIDNEQKDNTKSKKEKLFTVSPEIDSKIIAIVDAFELRVKLIVGIKTLNDKSQFSKSVSGYFLGFQISHSFIKKNGKIIKNQTIMTTPSKGVLYIKNQKLFSLKNINFEKLLSDIKNSGLKLDIEIDSTQGKVLAMLSIVKNPLFNIPKHFLITSNGVGLIRLRTKTDDLEKLLPPDFDIIERKITNKYEGYKTYFFHKIYNKDKMPLYIINSNGETVLKIQIENTSFKTERGITVGDRLGKLRAFYSDLLITVVENRIPYAYLKNTNIRFYLPIDKINFEKKIFPLDAKIVSIWIE